MTPNELWKIWWKWRKGRKGNECNYFSIFIQFLSELFVLFKFYLQEFINLREKVLLRVVGSFIARDEKSCHGRVKRDELILSRNSPFRMQIEVGWQGACKQIEVEKFNWNCIINLKHEFIFAFCNDENFIEKVGINLELMNLGLDSWMLIAFDIYLTFASFIWVKRKWTGNLLGKHLYWAHLNSMHSVKFQSIF